MKKANIYLNVTIGSDIHDDPDATAFFLDLPIDDLSFSDGRWSIRTPNPLEGSPIVLASGDSPAQAIGAYLSTFYSRIDQLVQRAQESLE